VAPEGDWTTRGGGLNTSLCIRHAVPLATVAHRGTQGIIHLLLQVFYFFRPLIGIASPCRMSTSQHQCPRWTRLLLCGLKAVITTTLVVEPSTSESSSIQVVAPPMHVRLHQASKWSELASSATTSRTPRHHRCCSRADASRACSRAPNALTIMYTQVSLHLGVPFFFSFSFF
jgi:hypothetical protein